MPPTIGTLATFLVVESCPMDDGIPEFSLAFFSWCLFFYFARKNLKDIYKHTYSVIHKIIHTFTVNKINN